MGTSIFAVMTALSDECDAINLSQGFPGFNPDQRLLDRVTHYLNSDANQYAPMPGVPSLRHAIAKKTADLYGRNICPDTELTVCDGATEGLFSTIHAVVHTGDEVIVFDPAYDSYAPAVAMAGGHTVHVPLLEGDGTSDYSVDWDRLARAINGRTRLIVFNFPHNPTGAVLSADDLDTLADLVRDTDVLLLADEVYEHIVFDGVKHLSFAGHDELWERSFVVSSFGKTYHATGWKLGFCIAPKPLMDEFRSIHQWVCYAVVTPIQHAIADYMNDHPEHFAELPRFYQAKRDRFCELLAASRFTFRPAEGTFFQILDYSDITDEIDTEYAKRLTREIGVASIPVSVFCEQPPRSRKLRFCFAKDDDILAAAAEKLCQL